MIDIEGIETQTNKDGQITHLTLDVEKYKDILAPIMNQLALSEKEAFDNKWRKGISPEELKQNLHKRIEKLWAK
jgi:BMFP domain-containing protein YqiC